MEIDIVIPFVNGNDPIWLSDYEKYCSLEKWHLGDGNKKIRFDGEDILKYVFRSICCHVPWVRKIHLLLYSESQIPEWLDVSKVHIVLHKDFIPEGHLPIFNSSAIEMFIRNIPDLSEHFLYMNDDILFNTDVTPDLYFDKENNPRIGIAKNAYKNGNILNAAYLTTFMNSAKLAAYGTDVRSIGYEYIYTTVHSVNPYVKSTLDEIYEKYGDIMENSITKFREEKNLNQYLYGLYHVFHKINGKYTRNIVYLKVNDNIDKLKKYINVSKYHEICVNDVETTETENKLRLREILDEYYPEKSIYEI